MGKLKNSILALGLAGLLSTGCAGCAGGANTTEEMASSKDPIQASGTKYAYILCPEDSKPEYASKAFDGGTKNAFLITLVEIYSRLRNSGYEPSNIYVLFDNGRPDLTENINGLEALMKEKGTNGQILAATQANHGKISKKLTQTISILDQFTMVVMSKHADYKSGNPAIKFYGNSGTFLPESLAATVKPIKAREQLVVVDSCHAGYYAKAVENTSAIIATSTDQELSIYSRIDQFARYLFSGLNNSASDTNQDGKITVSEAFQHAEMEREPILRAHEKAGHMAFQKVETFKGKLFNADKDFEFYRLRK